MIDPGWKDWMEYAEQLNSQYGAGRFKLWVVGSNYGIRDTKDGKTYGQLMLPMLTAKLKKEPKVPKNKAKLSSTQRQTALKHQQYEEELEHYGVLGMKWGVRRTPEQLGHDINKYERKRKRAEKAYVKVSRSKGTTSFAKYNKQSYKASKKLDKAEQRLKNLMYKNATLFNQSMTALNGKQADIGRKWLEFASATEEEQFWMAMANRMKAS